ncbi:hypothetical protein D3C75_903150 [compost metagenome]
MQRILPPKLDLRRKRQRQGQRGQEGLPAGQGGYRTPYAAIPVIANHKPSAGINLKRVTLLAQEPQPLRSSLAYLHQLLLCNILYKSISAQHHLQLGEPVLKGGMLRTLPLQLHPADVPVLQVFQIAFSTGAALQCGLVVFLASAQGLLAVLPVFCA